MAEIALKWLDSPLRIVQANYPKGWTWDNYHSSIDGLVYTIGDSDDYFYCL